MRNPHTTHDAQPTTHNAQTSNARETKTTQNDATQCKSSIGITVSGGCAPPQCNAMQRHNATSNKTTQEKRREEKRREDDVREKRTSQNDANRNANC